jgi:rhamnosyl/mannosyltransferase
MAWWVRKLHRQEHYDIAHLHFPDPMSHLAALTLPREVKLVISWHSDIVRQRNWLRLYRPLLDRIVARADAIIAATPLHFSSSTQLGACHDPARRFVVPYGIDFAPFTTPSAASAGARLKAQLGKRPIIFAIGRHVYYKGFEFLIEAMRTVVDDALLVLGGSGPLTASLKSFASSLSLQNRVLFTGRIPDDALPAYYHAADVFCLPSVEPSEAFGLVQVEAMACHKPVVSCELGNGVTYVNRHGTTGLVVPPRNPEALANAINMLLADVGLRHRMGEAGHARAMEEFTAAHMCTSTLAVYESLLAAHRPSHSLSG